MNPKPRARIFRGTARNIRFLARRLRAGELVAVPTETVYGLAGNAMDERACRRIFRAKGRPHTDPLIVHVHAIQQAEKVSGMNAVARRLAARFWPGPLTLVLPKSRDVPDLVTAGRRSVAVRMPAHPLFRRLLRLAATPLAVPSANRFGYVSPTTAEHVRQGLGTRIGYILDGGPSEIGIESTIVDLRNPRRPRILRPGAIPRGQIARVTGVSLPVPSRRYRLGSVDAAQPAPGMLPRHYSPGTPLLLHKRMPRAAGRDEAWLHLRRPRGTLAPNVFWLDSRGDMRAVARRLFAMLRKLDAMSFRVIHVEMASGRGLGEAINDRLRRAAGGA